MFPFPGHPGCMLSQHPLASSDVASPQEYGLGPVSTTGCHWRLMYICFNALCRRKTLLWGLTWSWSSLDVKTTTTTLVLDYIAWLTNVIQCVSIQHVNYSAIPYWRRGWGIGKLAPLLCFHHPFPAVWTKDIRPSLVSFSRVSNFYCRFPVRDYQPWMINPC